MVHISSLASVRDFLKGLPELLNTPITLKEKRVTLHNRRRGRSTLARGSQAEAGGIPFVLEGEIGKGTVTLYSINEKDFVVTPETFVLGDLRAGAFARIKGITKADTCYAQSIVLSQR